MELILLIIMSLFVEVGAFIVILKGIDLFITMRNKKKIWKSKYERRQR